MKQSSSLFIRYPGGEDGSGSIKPIGSDADKISVNEELVDAREDGTTKPFSEKVHDALQEWSNDDQRDQIIDDNTP